MEPVEDDLELARRAALAGAAVGLRYFAALARLVPLSKPDGSVVTEADRAVEAAIRRVLGRARPGDAVLGEEAGQTGLGSRRWIVDPIDGTALFVTGDDRWLVLVALEEAGEIVVGVAAVPAQGRIWWARRGGGAYEADLTGSTVTGERRVSVAPRRPDTVTGSRLSVVPDRLSAAEQRLVAPVRAAAPVLPWPVHPALLIARGDLDLAVQTRGQVWDFAATSLIVTEAGGRYSGLDGQTRPAAGASLYSRGAALHEAALALLRP